MIQKILAVLLVAALLAAPAAALQAGHYTKGSDEQIDYAIKAYEDFKRIYNNETLRSELKTFEVNGSKLYISPLWSFVYDATLHRLCFGNSIFLIDTNTGVMYDTQWKYDSCRNEVIKMTYDEFDQFAKNERQFVWNLRNAADAFGMPTHMRAINITMDW